ncbi:MAG TPA: DUF4332 domain-containing protein [Cytophagales bacterium]|nr:DUF4332 domain-containing protein [Cytophagales bacterium]HCR54495.1 DUF4332 domain-containing protein [Cytophagales bacterium]
MANKKLSDIEGIGPSYAKKLQAAGIRSVSGLLKHCATKSGRKKVATDANISESTILKWANMADLYRIKGVGSEYSQLLEKAGVDTVKELKMRSPQNLHEKMMEVNAKQKLVRQLPSLSKVEAFVKQAKGMAPKITY